ncbi:MAG TPA: helix-hairpin-helix domain-containing protein [Bacteroidetes bacterium]|nr:comE operon protein 1 [bacterium BMS3Bbin04]HDO65493.1 helix-hairpin-helix domain-containing protein [Bacteroidota bacterium]HEX04618.1 helix-hairpin-helix domain-containing protein [Bacteroidota bacterium]
MKDIQHKSRFALTDVERRTLFVLGILLVIGLIAKQVPRWSESEHVVIVQGDFPVATVNSLEGNSDTLQGGNASDSLALSTSPDVPSVSDAGVSIPDTVDNLKLGEGDQTREWFDLNTSSSEDLERIPGIGPVLAQRIVSWRDAHGRFERIEDLLLIDNIGEKRLATLKQHAFVNPGN